MGYVATGEKTGWPLYTPRYDGAFVAGLYAQQPQLAGNRQVIAAIPTWTTLTLGVGSETYSPSTPAGQITQLPADPLPALRPAADRADLDHGGRQVHRPRVRRPGRPRRRARGGRAARHDAALERSGDRHRRARRRGRAPDLSPPGEPPLPRARHRRRHVQHRHDEDRRRRGVHASARAGTSSRTRGRTAIDGLTARQALTFPVRDGASYELVKYVGVDTSLTSRPPRNAARAASRGAAALGWRQLLARHALAWRTLWRSDIVVAGRPELQAWVRGSLYALLASARQGQAYSVGPAGLSSDNYAGLIFWDAETWMYPGLLLLHPDIARSMLEYRYQTMSGARANAARLGYQGIFYPWTSAGAGDLPSECHSVDPPHCRTQVHLQGDIALAAWHYYLATKDAAWLRSRGWPLLKGIAEFWASRVTEQRRRQLLDQRHRRSRRVQQRRQRRRLHERRRRHRAAQRDAGGAGPRPARPRAMERDRRQAPHPLRREQARLRPVRRLQGHEDQAGGHGAAPVPAGVADAEGGRRGHARLLRAAHRPGRPGHDGLGARDRRGGDRRAGLHRRTPT